MYSMPGGTGVFSALINWQFFADLLSGNCYCKSDHSKKKKLLLYVGLIQGIGGLSFFKYFNFFITSFNDAFWNQ